MAFSRGYVLYEYIFKSGDMCTLAYIGAMFLNFCLCLGRTDICRPSQPKIQNCGANVG